MPKARDVRFEFRSVAKEGPTYPEILYRPASDLSAPRTADGRDAKLMALITSRAHLTRERLRRVDLSWIGMSSYPRRTFCNHVC